MTINPHRRLKSETVSLTLRLGSGQHRLDASLAYDKVAGSYARSPSSAAAKVGGGLDLMLHELGIQLSRAIQGRDPDTGAASERT